MTAELAARQAALAALHQEILACRRCAQAGHAVFGRPVLGGDPGMLAQAHRVMLVGQAPGRSEAENGRPFSGPAGKTLFGWLAEEGIGEAAFRRQVYMAAMTRCYPGPALARSPSPTPPSPVPPALARSPSSRCPQAPPFPRAPSGSGDRRPSPAELALCRPFLDRQLALIGPELIILVGGMAIEALVGKMPLHEAVGGLHVRDGVRYLPLPHPSGASRWHNVPANRELRRRAVALLAESGLIRP